MRFLECAAYLAFLCTFRISSNAINYNQPTLSICCRRASSSMGGSCLPRRSALRKIPSQAFALKKYFSGTLASKICDKVDSTAALGHSPVLSVEYSPSNTPSVSHDAVGVGPSVFTRRRQRRGLRLCDPDEFFEDDFEILSFVGAERSGDIFPNSESWVYSTTFLPHFLDDPHSLHKQAASGRFFVTVVGVFQPGALSCHAQILAWAAECDHIDRLYICTRYLADIAQMPHGRES